MGRLKSSFVLLFLLTLFPTVSRAETRINDSFSVSAEVLPQNLYIQLGITAEGKTPDEVVKLLAIADTFIKKNFPDYKGGYFNLKPVKVEDKKTKKEVVVGYTATARYTVKLNGQREETLLLSGLGDLVKKNKGLSYAVYSQRWETDRKIFKSLIFTLKLQALKEARKRAEKYGEILNKRCLLKEINLGNGSPFYPLLKAEGKSPFPKREKRELRIDARVVYICY